METRGNWTDLIGGVGVDIVEVHNQAMDEYKPGIGNVLQIASGTGAQETYTGKTGAGRPQLTDEADNFKEGKRYKTYNTTAVFNKYTNSLDVSAESISDRTYQSDLDEMKDLTISMNVGQDESGMQLFNGGFATTQTVNGYKMNWYNDGLPQFSTKHATVVPGASTQSNASSTGITFGIDNLETARVALVEQQTDDGLPTTLGGKAMIVLPEPLVKKGIEITQSELHPESANNNINVFRNGLSVDMTSSLFLDSANNGSDTAWFLTVPQRAKLFHIMREGISLNEDVNIKNEVVTYTIRARWANVSKDWRRTYGSKGDGVSYTG